MDFETILNQQLKLYMELPIMYSSKRCSFVHNLHIVYQSGKVNTDKHYLIYRCTFGFNTGTRDREQHITYGSTVRYIRASLTEWTKMGKLNH